MMGAHIGRKGAMCNCGRVLAVCLAVAGADRPAMDQYIRVLGPIVPRKKGRYHFAGMGARRHYDPHHSADKVPSVRMMHVPTGGFFMRFPILTAALALAAPCGPAMAAPSEAASGCVAGERPIKHHPNWSSQSDAICDYGFIDFNRRLAGLIEAPGGEVSVEWLKRVLGIPEFVAREGFEPNGVYVIKAAHQVALAGQDDWEMIIATYHHRREGVWGRKDDFRVDFLGSGLNPATEAAYKGRCISEAEVLDRALTAGWWYVPGTIESGTAGPLFMPGALVKDDGRRLVLVHLSSTTELPPRATLEATCAWIVEFHDLHETRAGITS